MKLDILAIGVHPDDVELSCSGTLLKHMDMGKSVGILDLTRGELGSRGTAETRDVESKNAAEVLGVSYRKNANLADGFFTHSPDNIKKIIHFIRETKPEIVLANAISDRHPDHGRAAKLVADACFYAGLIKIETVDEQGRSQKAWRPKAVYHYIQDHNLEPDFVIDVSPYMDKKIEAILAYKTQFYNPNDKNSSMPSTPISSKAFFDFLRAKGASYGRIANFEYAEGYQVARTPGVKNLFDLI
jgi:bacillithiol biosynthesis deacetylase BshB1